MPVGPQSGNLPRRYGVAIREAHPQTCAPDTSVVAAGLLAVVRPALKSQRSLSTRLRQPLSRAMFHKCETWPGFVTRFLIMPRRCCAKLHT